MFNVLRHFEPRSLDFITTRHTLEHSFVPLFQLWAYNQLLKDDGVLVVTVPSYHERWVWMTTHFHAVPPDSWHMLFHRAGFGVREFSSGSWKKGHAEFVEHRFVLEVESRELRLKGRPTRTIETVPESLPGGRAVTAEQSALGQAVPGTTRWVSRSVPWGPRAGETLAAATARARRGARRVVRRVKRTVQRSG
jgi:SAM-dependent methyltransferase